MDGTTRILAVTVALLALASGAGAQEEPRLLEAREAKERATAFLTVGARAPRPDLRKAETDTLDAVEVQDATHGPAYDLLLRRGDGVLRLLVRVDRTQGRVTYFSQPERDCIVLRYREDRTPRTADELAEEVASRVLFDRAALRRKAQEFLAHVVPETAGGARRFEVVREAEEREGLLVDAFMLVETPGSGVLACYENLVQMDLNPESGEVVSFRRTDLRHDVRQAPRIAADAALQAARARLGEDARPTEGPRLVVLPATERGAFQVLWLLAFPPARGGDDARLVAVDARDGRVIVPE